MASNLRLSDDILPEVNESSQDLQPILLNERMKSEQHRLNYEKLKAMHAKLVIEVQRAHAVYDVSHNPRQGQTLNILKVIEREVSLVKRLVEKDDADAERDAVSARTMNQPGCSTRDPESPLRQGQGTYEYLDETLSQGRLTRDGGTAAETEQNFKMAMSEILDSINRWRNVYLNLLSDYGTYTQSVEAAIISASAESDEKIKAIEAQVEKITQDFNKERSELDCSRRELNRGNSALLYENGTLREELEETRLKLEEKTTQYESLSRKTDDTLSLAKSLGQDETHALLLQRANAAESRCASLQEEVQSLRDDKEKLENEVHIINEQHSAEVKTLNGRLESYKFQGHCEKSVFTVRCKEANEVMETQQAYMREMDAFVRYRDAHNDGIIERVHTSTQVILSEANSTVQLVEQNLLAALTENGLLQEELAKTANLLQNMKVEALAHQHFTNFFVEQANTILEVLPHDSDSDPAMLINGITLSEPEVQHTSQREREEHSLTIILRSLNYWKGEYESRHMRMQSRMIQLEINLEKEKTQCKMDKEALSNRCQDYGQVKKLRKQTVSQNASKSVKFAPTNLMESDSEGTSYEDLPTRLTHNWKSLAVSNKKIVKEFRAKHEVFRTVLENTDKCLQDASKPKRH